MHTWFEPRIKISLNYSNKLEDRWQYLPKRDKKIESLVKLATMLLTF